MDSGLLLDMLQQTTQAAPATAETARTWFTMQFTIGDLTSVGSVIAAYVAIRERLARLEIQVEPMWQAWNLRNSERRRP